MIMNEEKINEVGELLNINSSDIKESKKGKFFKRFTYPITQIAFFIVSSITGLLFGYWENRVHTGYPFTSYTRVYTTGVPIFLLIHSGNAVFSSLTYRKYKLSKFHTFFIIISNLIFSFLCFILFYKLIYKDPFLGYAVRYGSYKKIKNKAKYSMVVFLENNSTIKK